MAGELAVAGRADAAPQRLQGAADAQPGEARDPRPGHRGAAHDVALSAQLRISNVEFGMRVRYTRFRVTSAPAR